ncbi:Neurobeachin-like 2, partial [Dryobates pubescens]
QQWLEAFVMNFEKIIALPSLEPRRPEESVSEIPVLPREVLQVLSQRLGQCVAQLPREEGTGSSLGQALLLLKFFIIICRNPENIQADRAPGFIPELLKFLRVCASKLRSAHELEGGGMQLESGMLHALHLCECLFDPYQTWRRQLSGEVISSKEKSKYKFAPAPLPPEFSTFFQEAFQAGGQLPGMLQLRLVHLFGAILSGSKVGDGGWIWDHPPHDGTPSCCLFRGSCLHSLVGCSYFCLQTQLAVLSAQLLGQCYAVGWGGGGNFNPPEGGEVGWGLSHLHLALDAIPAMLSCEDRPVLQAVFLSNNCFEHIIRLLQNSKASDGSSDTIAVHAVRVLTAIMSNSPSAKEVFKERIGYCHLYEVLRSHGQPTQRLLQELLNMAVEGDHSSFPARPIRNEQPLLILLAWLPALACQELQVLLSGWLRR